MSSFWQSWWSGLQKREQQAILVGAGLLLLVMLWAFGWQPYQQDQSKLAARIEARQHQLIEVNQIASRAKAMQGRQQSTVHTNARGDRSLLRLSDETARAAGLAAALKRIEPDSDQRVQVWLEAAPFDPLISWLEQLEKQYGVSVDSASISRVSSAVSGSVNAHITLQEQR